MSSGTRYDSSAGKNIIRGVGQKIMGKLGGKPAIDPKALERIARLGMTERQHMLNRLLSFYKCEQYAGRKFGWDGKPYVDALETEAISSAGFLPPGFYDAGSMFPLKFRRPSAPYHIVRVIVDRFSGLLFSQRRHPHLQVEDDPETEDFVHALVDEARLWAQMSLARQYGGSMGSVAVGFQFVDGKPIIEVHDPRWLFPEFLDRCTLKLRAIEKKYMYPTDLRDPETGLWHTIWFWYRRIIDDRHDIVFAPAMVGEGDEPVWEVEKLVEHNLGFCPVIWGQNLPVQDDIDGDSDCHGILELTERIDALQSQADRGIMANLDPTLHVATDLPISEMRKGSDNCVRTEKGGSLGYVEIQGTGPHAAIELADKYRSEALEVAQCVIETPGHAHGNPRTATEVERTYAAMLAKADVLREQYGEHIVKPLVKMMIQAVRKLDEPVLDETGTIVRQSLDLPLKVLRDELGNIIGKRPRKPGSGGSLILQWPDYFEPNLSDVQIATQAAAEAKAAGLIDDEHASKFVGDYFRVDDVSAMVGAIRSNAVQQQAELQSMAMSGFRQDPQDFDPPREPEPEIPR